MSSKAQVSVRGPITSSWSELGIEDTFPDSPLDFDKAKRHTLLDAIDPKYPTQSITQPVKRDLTNHSMRAIREAQELDLSISPRGLLASTYGNLFKKLLGSLKQKSSLVLPPPQIPDPDLSVGIPDPPETSTSAIDSEYSESGESENFSDTAEDKQRAAKTGGAATLPLTVIVDTLRRAAVLFAQISWGSVQVIGAVVHSTLVVLGCSVSSDCLLLLEVVRVWLLFARHIYTALLFSALVILLKLLSTVGWVVGFFDRKWPTPETESEVATATPSVAIPKSRTFSVISSLTQSFSSGTFGSQKTSRNVSRESQVITTPAQGRATIQSHIYQHNASGNRQTHLTSLTAPTSGSYPSLSNNPKEITTAMPPQYWAGRFMALQDRFHNELLESHRLARICGGQSAQPFGGITPQASVAPQNNPSMSIYAIPRVVQVGRHSSVPNNSSLRPRSRSLIPCSSTSCSVLQRTSYNTKSSPPSYAHTVRCFSNDNTATVHVPYQNRHGYAHLLTTGENTIQELPSAATPSHSHGDGDGSGMKNDKACSAITVTGSSICQEANTITINQNTPLTSFTTAAAASASAAATAAAPIDGDDASRTRRVFVHLESLCTTDAARASLRQWQAAYAHRMGNDGGLNRMEARAKASSTEQKQKQKEEHGAMGHGCVGASLYASVGVGR
ncbi:hypothetical protein MYCTH_94826 [Thermothelomyces thermophilus ATCC 42464]|uniref:Uncharacterized protein n=1 Tax=Thermothelomyces thermophilus (strain ATCC 42464 / BCRC 31852 / DSM 1799) TaxID=573729 RepID=G2QF98_THET4|nr:uncharacterized protein MYCTH_94826 [Thermothelomyces thermophilus ATCC 42464]AEO59127.1 hypothetical protein MYCTH_94826 [Thermothelomyces thermophilus ATCC 42464]